MDGEPWSELLHLAFYQLVVWWLPMILLSPMARYGHANQKPTLVFGCACETQEGIVPSHGNGIWYIMISHRPFLYGYVSSGQGTYVPIMLIWYNHYKKIVSYFMHHTAEWESLYTRWIRNVTRPRPWCYRLHKKMTPATWKRVRKSKAVVKQYKDSSGKKRVCQT